MAPLQNDRLRRYVKENSLKTVIYDRSMSVSKPP